MKHKAKVINGIAVDCRFVEGDEKMIDNRMVSWESGSRVYIVAEGDRVVTKYRVNPEAEKKVSSFFDNAAFGIYISLILDVDGLIIDVKQITA